jgi:hypothetical protein
MKHVGNCNNIINWDNVIDSIKYQTPAYVGPSHKKGDPIPGLEEVVDIWDRSKFVTVHQNPKNGTVGWDMFLPGQFDPAIADTLAEFVGITKWRSAWISRINIGLMAPWHWDVHDDEEELSKIKGIRRFHCHIGKPAHGHILLLEDEIYYNQQQGSTYEWPSRTSWHAGMNCGIVSKYLFNIWG